MLKNIIWKFLVLLLITGSTSFAQNVSGIVLDKSNSKEEAIIGATINWIGTKIATTTDIEGKFSIARTKSKKLVISFVGYKSDTLNISNETACVQIQVES
jgi:hypothetical protein